MGGRRDAGSSRRARSVAADGAGGGDASASPAGAAKAGRAAAQAGRSARPLHKRCGITLARLYYTVYSGISRGSRTLPLSDWMWCDSCAAPVHMVQRDMLEEAAAAAVPAPRNGRRRK